MNFYLKKNKLYIIQISELQMFINQSSIDGTVYKNLLNTKLRSIYKIYQFNSFSSFVLLDFDNNEYTNYRNILSLMLFDRWQHCRQMSDRARNIYEASALTDTNSDTFINEIYTLISNTAYLASIIKQNNPIKVNENFN